MQEDKSNWLFVKRVYGHLIQGSPLEQIYEPISLELTFPTRLKKEGKEVLVGDYVEYEPSSGRILNVRDRISQLPKPRVANVELCVIVVSITSPEPDLAHLDRLLALTGLLLPEKTIICVNKIDLGPDLKFPEIYEQLGYRVFPVSVKKQTGLMELEEYLKGKLVLLAGRSGVGKSSIISHLNPKTIIKIGAVSEKAGSGTHTTRVAEIFSRADLGFHLLDTPGFSRLDVCLSPQELSTSINAFPELINYPKCSFPSCKHLGDPGCQVVFVESRARAYGAFLAEAEEWESMNLKSRKAKQNQQQVKEHNASTVPVLAPRLRKVEIEESYEDEE